MSRMPYGIRDKTAERLCRGSNLPSSAGGLGTPIKTRGHTQTAMAAGMAFAI
jgi:hypothetical protein